MTTRDEERIDQRVDEIKVIRQEIAFMARSMARLEASRDRIKEMRGSLSAQYFNLSLEDKMGPVGGRLESWLDDLGLAMDQVESAVELMPRDTLEIAIQALNGAFEDVVEDDGPEVEDDYERGLL